jgi:predicted RNase H-like nuclease (RuvC/YqgF family)
VLYSSNDQIEVQPQKYSRVYDLETKIQVLRNKVRVERYWLRRQVESLEAELEEKDKEIERLKRTSALYEIRERFGKNTANLWD